MVDKDGLAGRVAVVTGASGGIGRAIAVELANHRVRVCIIGRDNKRMAETAKAVGQHTEVAAFQLDLTKDDNLQPLLSHLQEAGRLDILIHCAGVIHLDPMGSARIADFDVQYATNVRAPYRLTQVLLDRLVASRGQIVFINSSAGVAANQAEIGQYAGTKHALKAVADSLRAEVNPKGVRVLSVYPGRTATPMQEAASKQVRRPYRPASLVQPTDIASVVVHALTLPATAEITDIYIRPMTKT